MDQEQVTLGPQALGVLRNRIASGDIVLFTGAGFSLEAKTVEGGHELPTSRELRSILWPIAFPNIIEDEESSLGDVFECAIRKSQRKTCDVLERCFRVDHTNLPGFYAHWFSIPWARAYSLNIDDLEIAAAKAFELPRSIQSVSPTDPVPVSSNSLTYVHLNGQLKDAPNVTFSAAQYGQRVPGRDPWYSTLVADLVSKTVIFVGTTLEEPPLWEHLELRGQKAQSREFRPRSFLVTPDLPVARREMLKKFNIEHIPLNARKFAELVLAGMKEQIVEGTKHLTGATARSHRQSIAPSVSQLRMAKSDINLGQYLLGREPTFQDAIDGYAVQRTFEKEILEDPTALEARVMLITGTAGTGKSTALLRLALTLDAEGKGVGWCDPAIIELGIPAIRSAIVESEYDYVVIDNVDLFGTQASRLLRELAHATHGPRILAAARSTNAERLKLRSALESSEAHFVLAPPLTDSDIDGLIAALQSAGLLGQLAGKSLSEQRHVFRHMAGRQLLVSMIEATSGRQFNDKIDDECAQLPESQMLVYAICAIATRYRFGLTLEELLSAVGEANADALESVDSLRRQHMLIEVRESRLAVRHRIVADQVVLWLRQTGRLAEPVEGLLFAMASQYLRDRNIHSRAFRLMVRLMNHLFMIEEIGDHRVIRGIYESLTGLLSDDYHFWLQRGSFELERGDLDLAENYLNQARGLAGDDHRVRTAWSYMSLRRAAELAQGGEEGWRERAEEAMAELRDVIDTRPNSESHAFHILGSQGLHFVRRAPLTFEERFRILGSLRGTVRRGVSIHGDSDELKQLLSDLEKEYLLLAVPEEKRNDTTTVDNRE